MGCGSSAPAVKDETVQQRRDQRTSNAVKEAIADDGTPDAGLSRSFEYVRPLGKGGSGETFLYKDKATGEPVAIKLIKRPLPRPIVPNILREISIQAELGEGHVNVINAKEAILTHKHLALVMEYAAGGSLTSYVSERWQNAQQTGLFLSEDEARFFFKQFIEAVAYCHTHNVAHRDLKLDNTLLDGEDPPKIKLCDFGFAKSWGETSNMFTHIGTPVYMAPDILNSRNGMKGYDATAVDVWAAGVLLIVMLLGTFPFDHTENPDPNSKEAHMEVWLQQVRTKWSENPRVSKSIESLSPDCMDLLNRMFVLDEKARITMTAIRDHPWYNAPLQPKYKDAMKRLHDEQHKVYEYTSQRKLNEAALRVRAQQLKEMIEQASARPPAGQSQRDSPLNRIDLRESAVMESAAGGNAALNDVIEEE